MIEADFISDGHCAPLFSYRIDEDRLYQQFRNNLPVHLRGREFLVIEIRQHVLTEKAKIDVFVREIV